MNINQLVFNVKGIIKSVGRETDRQIYFGNKMKTYFLRKTCYIPVSMVTQQCELQLRGYSDNDLGL